MRLQRNEGVLRAKQELESIEKIGLFYILACAFVRSTAIMILIFLLYSILNFLIEDTGGEGVLWLRDARRAQREDSEL